MRANGPFSSFNPLPDIGRADQRSVMPWLHQIESSRGRSRCGEKRPGRSVPKSWSQLTDRTATVSRTSGTSDGPDSTNRPLCRVRGDSGRQNGPLGTIRFSCQLAQISKGFANGALRWGHSCLMGRCLDFSGKSAIGSPGFSLAVCERLPTTTPVM